jgi:hypothetical protein
LVYSWACSSNSSKSCGGVMYWAAIHDGRYWGCDITFIDGFSPIWWELRRRYWRRYQCGSGRCKLILEWIINCPGVPYMHSYDCSLRSQADRAVIFVTKRFIAISKGYHEWVENLLRLDPFLISSSSWWGSSFVS